jgi:hypothetical protein
MIVERIKRAEWQRLQGALGKVAQWEAFQGKWRKVLGEFGVKQMHRVESESFKGEFKEWNGTRRTKFLQRIQPIIRDHINVPTCASSSGEEWAGMQPWEPARH